MKERKRKDRFITVDKVASMGRYFDYRAYARVRLQGRWLEAAGFMPGIRVKVAVAQGQLILSRMEG